MFIIKNILFLINFFDILMLQYIVIFYSYFKEEFIVKSKINSLSKFIVLISKIASVILIIGILSTAIVSTYVYVNKNSDNAFLLSSNEETIKFLMPNEKKLPYNIKVSDSNKLYCNNFVLVSIIEISSMAFYLLILILIHNIFSDILKEHSPFETKNVNRIKYIAICIIAVTLVKGFIATVGSSILNISCNVSLDAPYLFMGVIFYCLSEIFAYGTYLQTEHDETI